MLHKSCPVKIKAAGEADGLAEGQFEAIVSVFGNVDSYGDVVMPGAFADNLAEWEASGDPIPVYYSHRMDDPDYCIGHVLEAKETPEGLWVRAQLDLDGPKSAQVHRLLKGRRVTQFSFAYDVLDAAWAERDGEEVYELRKLKVYEVGPTPIGANQSTQLLAVKSAELAKEARAGRVFTKQHLDSLRTAQEAIGAVIAAAEANDQAKASTSGPVKPEEPVEAKGEEPSRGVSAKTLAALSILTLAREGEGGSL